MTSVAHNGFGCPYCRTKMAEEQEQEEDEETIYSDEEEEDDMFDENALRGFRFFWNNLNGEEHNEDDTDQENLDECDEASTEEEDANIPSASFVAEKLQQQGVSYEQLVKMILLQHAEYADDEVSERLDDETFGKIRVIISNYTPEQAAVQVPQLVQNLVGRAVGRALSIEPLI